MPVTERDLIIEKFVQAGIKLLKEADPELFGKEGIVFRFCYGARNWAIPESKGANFLLAHIDSIGELGNARNGCGNYVGDVINILFFRAVAKLNMRDNKRAEPSILPPGGGKITTDSVWTLKYPKKKAPKRAAAKADKL